MIIIILIINSIILILHISINVIKCNGNLENINTLENKKSLENLTVIFIFSNLILILLNWKIGILIILFNFLELLILAKILKNGKIDNYLNISWNVVDNLAKFYIKNKLLLLLLSIISLFIFGY